MGPSVSFPLPLRIAQKLPVRNSWEINSKSYRIPLPIFHYFELIREVLANTQYLAGDNRRLTLLKRGCANSVVGLELADNVSQSVTKQKVIQGEIIYAPPPSPYFWPKGISGGGGWGCIFWGPTRQEFYTPPPFYTPPTPRRVFSGGGWGCIKFGPVSDFKTLHDGNPFSKQPLGDAANIVQALPDLCSWAQGCCALSAFREMTVSRKSPEIAFFHPASILGAWLGGQKKTKKPLTRVSKPVGKYLRTRGIFWERLLGRHLCRTNLPRTNPAIPEKT